MEKLKDGWGNSTCLVTQSADGYLLWRMMFFSSFIVINLSPSTPSPPSVACVLRSSAQMAPSV